MMLSHLPHNYNQTLRKINKYAKSKNIEYMFVNVPKLNPWLKKLYERYGFNDVGKLSKDNSMFYVMRR